MAKIQVMSIEWHEQNLKNRKNYFQNRFNIAAKLVKDLERDHKDNLFYEEQINEAKKKGKTSFDQDKFMVKKEK